MKILFAALLAASVCAPASATTIFSDNFDDYQAGGFGTQPGTGLQIGAFGSLGAWDNYGVNSVHAENRGSGNWAAMLYANAGNSPNALVTKNAFENVLGVTYTVSFESAGTAWSSNAEGTAANDRLLFSLIDADSGQAMVEYSYNPTDWTGASSNPYSMGSFSYLGTGSGNLKLSILGVSDGYRFGGAVDNVSIDSVPEPAMLGLFGMGAIGLGLSRRRKAA